MKFKRGQKRDDGKIYWGKSKTCKNGEYWISEEKFYINLEKEKTSKKHWCLKNKEKVKEQSRKSTKKWKEKNPEKSKKVYQDWYRKNKSKVYSQTKIRKCLINKTFKEDHNKKIEIILRDCCSRISNCLKIKHHIDHIIPLASGGFHHHCNLQVIPAVWNWRKNCRVDFVIP
jgi:hypothetical protein